MLILKELLGTYTNIKKRRIVQGGGTITQQLAKNLFLTPERSFTRKLHELILSFWLEMRFSKEQILSIYLNEFTWGQERMEFKRIRKVF